MHELKKEKEKKENRKYIFMYWNSIKQGLTKKNRKYYRCLWRLYLTPLPRYFARDPIFPTKYQTSICAYFN